MIVTSTEFDAALESELDRLVVERMAGYPESDEFYDKLNAIVQEEMNNSIRYISWPHREALHVSIAPTELDALIHINLEQIIDNEIAEAGGYEGTGSLPFILERLELMASKVRSTLDKLA